MQSFIAKLKNTIPEDNWPWVLAALRQDEIIWKSLQDNKFSQKVITHSKGDIRFWSPASIALLAIKQPIALDRLLETPLQPVSHKLRNLAANAFEELAVSTKKNGMPDLNLEKAGLLALALRERGRLLGNWDNLLEDLKVAPLDSWVTPLACLIGMLPDPTDLLNVFLSPKCSYEQNSLVIHALISNPLPPDEISQIIYSVIENHDLQKQLEVLRIIAKQRRDLVENLANKIIEDYQKSPEPTSSGFDQIQNLLQLSEILQFGGQHSQAMPLMEEAWKTLRRLTADKTAQLAHSAARNNDTKTALEALNQATHLAGNDRNPNPNLTLAKIETGQLNPEHLQEYEQTDLPNEQIQLASKVAAAQIAFQSEDNNRARELAQEAYEIAIQTKYSHEIQSDDTKEYFNNSPPDFIRPLTKLLLDLGFATEANKTVILALENSPNDPDLLSYQSQAQLICGNLNEANHAAHIAVGLQPDRIDLRRHLTKVLINGRRWEEAVKELDIIVSRQTIPLPNDLLSLAKCALQANDTKLAANACQQLIKLAPAEGEAYAVLGEALLILGNPQAAIENFQKSILLTPQLPSPWINLAEQQNKSGQPDLGIKTLLGGMDANPEDPQIPFALGKAYLKKNNQHDALAAFETAARLVSDIIAPSGILYEEIAHKLGKTLFELDRLDQAHKILEKAHIAYPVNPEIAHAYGRTLLAQNESEAAIAAISVAKQSNPNNINVLLDYARAHLAHGLYPEEAVKAATRALELEEDRPETLAILAEATAKNNDFQTALVLYQQALETPLGKESEWQLKLSLGLSKAAIEQGHPEIAITRLLEAQQSLGPNIRLTKALSEAYSESGLIKDALETAKKIFRIAPKDTEALVWLANQAFSFDAYECANEAFGKAYQLAPEKTEFLVRKGSLMLELGKKDAAIQTFDNLLSSKHTKANDLRQAAHALIGAGVFAKPVEYLDRAIELIPEPSPVILLELAVAQKKNKTFDEALETIEEIIRISPNNPEILIEKAHILVALDRPRGAIASIDKALDLAPNNPQNHFLAADMLYETGDLPAALEHANNGLNLDPHNLHMRYLAAELARACLLDDKAIEIINKNGDELNNLTSDDLIASPQTGLIDVLCIQAELALEKGEEIIAAQIIEPVIANESISPRLLALQTRFTQRSGNHKKAAKIFRSALKSGEQYFVENPSTIHKSILYSALIEAAIELQDWEKAYKLSKQTIKEFPTEPLQHLHLARCIILRAELQRICQTLEAIQHAPGVVSLNKQSEKDFSEAIKSAKRLATSEKAQRRILGWELRGNNVFHPESFNPEKIADMKLNEEEAASVISALRLTGNNTEAIEFALNQIEHPEVLQQLAMAYAKENPKEALISATKAAEIDPTNPLNHSLAAFMARRSADTTSAIRSINQGLAIWQDEPRWHLMAAKSQLENQQANQAILHLDQAIQLEKDYAPSHLALGQAHLMNETPEMAIRALEKACSLDSNDGDAWLALASANYQAGNLSKAEKFSNQASKFAPTRIEPLIIKAQIALDSDKSEKAKKIIQKARKLEPDNPKALILLAKSLNNSKRPKEAIKVLDEAISQASDPTELTLEKVEIIKTMGGEKASLEALKKLSEQFPNETKVLVALTNALADAGETTEAIQISQHALSIALESFDPKETAKLHFLLGTQLHQGGQLDQAIHHLSEAIEQSPNSLEPYLEIGLVHQKRRQPQLALDYFQQAIEVAPYDSRAFVEAGRNLKESKDYIAAEEMFRRAVFVSPKETSIQRQLAAIVALNLIHQPRSITASVDV
ncbi:MAG: tetratricopeptide repeat protein [Chloroflexi bacterium]|nr:tetratricopeptide repeat protein [Chloroflexota bacterium]